jgi:cysteine synthase A
LDTIGNTPLVELRRLTRNLSGRLLAKLDYLSPGYSKKDRIALQMIEDAEATGELRPGQTVVELTSGNTGIGLAIVCSIKGYPFVAVMSRGNSPERGRMIRALGAEIVLVDQAPGSIAGQVSGADLELVDLATKRITEERSAFRPDQFERAGNTRAHALHTGPELWEQASGRIDAFCDFVGTGGTFAGVAAALKQRNSAVRCYVIEPSSAASLAGNRVTSANHRIQGGGYSKSNLPLLDAALIDGFLQVSDEEAIAATRRLARDEGIFAGFSSGANVVGALQLLAGHHAGQTITVILPDSGLKYLSTDLWP